MVANMVAIVLGVRVLRACAESVTTKSFCSSYCCCGPCSVCAAQESVRCIREIVRSRHKKRDTRARAFVRTNNTLSEYCASVFDGSMCTDVPQNVCPFVRCRVDTQYSRYVARVESTQTST